MNQLPLFGSIYADQYIQEGLNFHAPRIGDVTFLNGLNEPVHRWFRLTPSYSPDLVRHLIDELACDPKLLLCDPFLGKGTTTIEAKKLGLRAIGIEINPLLKLASEYALTWEVDLADFVEHAEGVEKQVSEILQDAKGLSFELAVEQFDLALPTIHNVFRWWRQEVLKELLLLKSVLWSVRNENYRHLYWLALCSSVIDCANVHRNHPTITFDDNSDREIDVLEDFRTNINAIIDDLRRLPDHAKWGNARVALGDSTRLSEYVEEEIDRVITSPPYPNRFSYVHTTRPQLFFMDVFTAASESADLDCAAIGGTWGKATSNLYTGEVAPNDRIADLLFSLIAELRPKSNLMCNYAVKYFNMIDSHIEELRRISSRQFRGAYVVGNSRLSGVEVPTDVLLAKIFERNGFSVDGILVLRKRGGKKELYETAVCVSKA